MPSVRQWRDLGTWASLVVIGMALTGAAVALHARVGTSAPPFTGRYRLAVGINSLIAPAVAAAVLLAVHRGAHERLPWKRLLGLGYLSALGWALGLALVDGGSGLAHALSYPGSYAHDVPAVGNSPAEFLRTFVSRAGTHAAETRQHPPGPVLALWVLDRVGLRRPAAVGLVITAVGCLSVPLVAVAVRSLCHERAARRLLPALVLAPYAVWLAVSLDAVTLTLCAAGLAAGVVGSERQRPFRSAAAWSAGAGLLVGLASVFSFSAPWLGISLAVTYFVHRRPVLNVVSGVTALVPLAVLAGAGFGWAAGLTAAQADFADRVDPHRSWLLWIALDVLLVAIACGPVLVPALRKMRRTAGWPFLVGAGLAVVFAIGSGLSRGEAERSFLPFFPWLLVAAVAPEPGEDDGGAARTPGLLVAAGAVTAVLLEAGLRTVW